MPLFKKTPEPIKNDEFVAYVIRKAYGLKTTEEINAKLHVLRCAMPIDEAARAREEAHAQEVALEAQALKVARHELALKHLHRIKAHFRPTSFELSGTSTVVPISDVMTLQCPECGKEIDVSAQVMQLAVRIEKMGMYIDRALADPGDMRSASIMKNSIIRINHSIVYDGKYCSTIIEVFIDGCRNLGEIGTNAFTVIS